MPLLKIYAITTIVLALKMSANSIVQGLGRARNQIFTNPEDVATFGGKLEAHDVEIVQRGAAVWRNDLENIPLFLILAWIYVAANGLSSAAFQFYCAIFVVARISHTIFYLNAVQPWRTIAYTVGVLVTFALIIHLAIEVAFA